MGFNSGFKGLNPCGLMIVPNHKEIEGPDQKFKRGSQRQYGHLIRTPLFFFFVLREKSPAINCPQYRKGHRSTMKHISTHSATKHRTDCWSITISTGETITNIGIRNIVSHSQFEALIGFQKLVNTLRKGSFKLFKRPFPGFLTILTL